MRANVGLDEAAPERHGDGLRARVDAQLREDVLDVGRDGLRADDEIARDLTLRPSFREQTEDLALARAEVRLVAVSVPVRRPRAERRSDRLTRARSSPESSGFTR